jgi:tetratricopeptide (TPR) repeat protein
MLLNFEKILIYLYSLIVSILIVGIVDVIILYANNDNKKACLELDPNKAIEDFHSAIKINPANPVYYINIGLLYGEIEKKLSIKNLINNNIIHSTNLNAAIFNFEKAYSLNPDDMCICHNLGLLYQSIGKNQDAEFYLKRAYSLSKENSMILINLGLLYENSNRMGEAIEAYSEAIVYSPEIIDSQFYTDLIRKNTSLSANILDKSITYLEKDTIGDNPINLARLGKMYLAQENISDAEKLFHKVITQLPNLNRPWFYLGQIAFTKKDSILAKEYFSKAELLDPSDVLPILYQSYLEKEDSDDKIVYYSKIVDFLERRVTNRYIVNSSIYKAVSKKNTIIIPEFLDYIKPKVDKETICYTLIRYYKEKNNIELINYYSRILKKIVDAEKL